MFMNGHQWVIKRRPRFNFVQSLVDHFVCAERQCGDDQGWLHLADFFWQVDFSFIPLFQTSLQQKRGTNNAHKPKLLVNPGTDILQAIRD